MGHVLGHVLGHVMGHVMGHIMGHVLGMDHGVESGSCGERLVYILLVELVRLMDKGLLARDRSIEGGLSRKLVLTWEL